ncbi:hypothetical protein BN85412990 [Alteracholeplasma palmae J233]|uniref:Uncharacterized protein n=1 Tax=Alteracholeplasma palmae (strain ATCC 49389 / J233) TaxID=1318466 RepID=U4KSA6_ALTPJ|nr:hypothetical protein [Alteracholeplasma palmae]CCV64876.1 hypothetical protein BN85412990 [Alteracholeplasma palmae J233]
MKNKKLFLPIVIMLLLLTLTGGAYAYWASSINGANTNTSNNLNIGQAGVVTTQVTVNGTANTQTLVPVGREVSGETVSKITTSFQMNWTGSGAEGVAGTISYEIVSVTNSENQTLENLFTLKNLSSSELVVGTPKTVTLDIEFTDEPSTAAEYAKIAGKQITLTIKFTVTP